MTTPDIRIDYLANHPAVADGLAKISWTEWRSIYEARRDTFADVLKACRERMNIDHLPLALVAFDGDKLVGTVSLKPQDLEVRPELTPWLGGLFVAPEWRHRGVASLLLKRAVEEARRLKLAKLYLWTSSAEGLYRKLDWQPVERLDYCGRRIVVMRSDLQMIQPK